MAPNFRPNTQTRRGNRGAYVEHDDFEGLPVRQWREEWVNVAPPPPAEMTQKHDIWAVELPHGMPKDSHLLPQHTQELLRAARSGRLYKRPAPAEEEEAEADAAAEKTDKKEEDLSTKGFMVKVWKQVPRNAEGATISHLAKRRKNMVTLSSNLTAGQTSGPTITKATVRRIDAAGNPYTQEVTLTEGQPVDGEIISTTVVPAPNANANGDGNAAATPVRRRPPPPKRKAKGPGRGRKKKLLPLPVTNRAEGTATGAEGAADDAKPEGTSTNGIKQEGDNYETKNQDSEMADGDDDDDDDDDGEDGDEEEGEIPETENGTETGNEKENSVDQAPNLKNSPSADPPVITAPALDPDAMDLSPGDETPITSHQPSPPIASLPPLHPPSHLTASRLEGSPLKNVIVPSPTEPAPSMPSIATTLSKTTTTPPESKEAPQPVPTSVGLGELPQTQAVESATQEISEIPPRTDIEMADATTMQTDTMIKTEPVSGTMSESTVVEGFMNTTEAQLNDAPPMQTPVAEGTADVTGLSQPQGIPQLSPPNVEQPASIVPLAPEQAAESTPNLTPAIKTKIEAPQDPVAQSVNELLNQPSTAEQSSTLPPLNPLQTTSEGHPAVEEKEPESPDLLGGLEAALDRHSEESKGVTGTEIHSLDQQPMADPLPTPVAETGPMSTEPVKNGESVSEARPETAGGANA